MFTGNRCPPLTIPSGSRVNSSAVDYGVVVALTCLPGFKLTSDVTFTKCSNGKWTDMDKLGTCEGKRDFS